MKNSILIYEVHGVTGELIAQELVAGAKGGDFILGIDDAEQKD